jgi:multiple sugar transport system substrate-binding protein
MAVVVFPFALVSGEAYGATEIVFLSPETSPEAIATDMEIIERFQTANPDITVTLDHADLNTLLPKLSAQLRAGTSPDVAFFSPRYVNDLVVQNALVELGDVFQEIGDLPEKLLVPTPDGKIYDIPAVTESIGLYYRTDLFEEAGLEPPKTWDEWLAAAEKLTVDKDGDGKIDQYGFGFCGDPNQLGFAFQSLTWSNGGNYFDAENRVTIDAPEVVEALEFLGKMSKFAPPGAENVKYTDLGVMFSQGLVATVRYPGRLLLHVERYGPELNGKVGFVPTPLGPKNNEQIIHACINDFVVINTGNEETTEAAKKFVKFYMQDEQYLLFIRNATPGHALPVRASIKTSDDYYAPDEKNNNHLAKWKDTIQTSIEYVSTCGVDYHMRHKGVANPYYGRALSSPVYSQELVKFVVGETDAASALSAIAKDWREEFEIE